MSTITSYDMLKDLMENITETADMLREMSVPENEVDKYVKKATAHIKTLAREFYKQQEEYRPDPLSVPIMNTKHIWRTVSDRDSDGNICGDSCTDFIIIPDEGQTYQELDEYVQDHCPYYYRSGYDFPTGRMITYGTSFTRTRLGILITHSRGIDW